jgi:hypothetical protein
MSEKDWCLVQLKTGELFYGNVDASRLVIRIHDAHAIFTRNELRLDDLISGKHPNHVTIVRLKLEVTYYQESERFRVGLWRGWACNGEQVL